MKKCLTVNELKMILDKMIEDGQGEYEVRNFNNSQPVVGWIGADSTERIYLQIEESK